VRYGRPMSQALWTAVDRFVEDQFVSADESLEQALIDSARAGLPPHNVSPCQGKLLMLLARLQCARAILEIGTLGGYSAIWLARGLPEDGRLITLEADQKHAEVARNNVARAGLADVVEVRVGNALDTLPQIAAEERGPFDVVFIDADKAQGPSYFAWALRLSRRGTLIIADNVVREGAVIDAGSDDPRVQGARRLLDVLANEPRVSATAIQTVGSKGHDGFALALVTSEPRQVGTPLISQLTRGAG